MKLPENTDPVFWEDVEQKLDGLWARVGDDYPGPLLHTNEEAQALFAPLRYTSPPDHLLRKLWNIVDLILMRQRFGDIPLRYWKEYFSAENRPCDQLCTWAIYNLSPENMERALQAIPNELVFDLRDRIETIAEVTVSDFKHTIEGKYQQTQGAEAFAIAFDKLKANKVRFLNVMRQKLQAEIQQRINVAGCRARTRT